MWQIENLKEEEEVYRDIILVLVVSGVCLRSSGLPIFGLRYYLSEQLEVLGPWPPENKHTTSVPVYIFTRQVHLIFSSFPSLLGRGVHTANWLPCRVPRRFRLLGRRLFSFRFRFLHTYTHTRQVSPLFMTLPPRHDGHLLLLRAGVSPFGLLFSLSNTFMT